MESTMEVWMRQERQRRWANWITANWGKLVNGAKIVVPNELGAPHAAGFYRIPLAHPVGQRQDWGMSYDDGSRIHVQDFGSGRYIAHRDKFDPKRGLESAVAHVMQETPYPGLVTLAGLIFLFAKASTG